VQDYFEQAKIRMTFNLAILNFITILLLVVTMYILKTSLFAVINGSIGLLAVFIVLAILKYLKNGKAASVFFSIVIMTVISTGTLFNKDVIGLGNLLFYATSVLYAYFTLGKRWGIAVSVVSLIVWTLYTKFRLYDYMHNESVYHNTNPMIGIIAGFVMLTYIVIQFLNLKDSVENKIKITNVELKLAKKEVERALQIQEQFLANTSHEVRSPLNGITGLTRQLLDTPISETQKNYLQAIKTSSDNLLHIINDILDVCKIRANKIEFEKITFDLRQLVKTLQTALQHKTEEKGIYLKYTVNDNVPQALIGDPVRLYQVLLNLTSNAVKFTEKGGILIEIKNTTTENIPHLEFKITDTGIGIPEDKLEYIFENFTQAESDTNRKYGGTGLGLSICKSLVEQQGGNIRATSTLGLGSVFIFNLEFHQGDPSQLEVNIGKNPNLAFDLENINILVVDDNPINRHVALQDLIKLKAKADVADNAVNALTYLNQKKYDLVLMDVYMPGLTGLEATSIIRSNTANLNHKTPIIAFSASVSHIEKERCLSAGMNDYISKPFDPEFLCEKIRKWTSHATSSVSPIEKRKVTNLDYLSKTLGLNQDGVKKVVSTYLKTVPLDLEQLNKNFSENQLQEVWNICHKLKQSVNFVGATDIVNLLSELETEVKKETINEKTIELLVKKANELIQLSVQELKNQ
jgi:signal transduction histidine kinase/CheY-like chemotaxis protein/HPt (histidine-containing phosphotransfer) domain-containing protein